MANRTTVTLQTAEINISDYTTNQNYCYPLILNLQKLLTSNFKYDVERRNKSIHHEQLSLIDDKILIYSFKNIQVFGKKGQIPEIEKKYVTQRGKEIKFIGIEKTHNGNIVAAIITLKTRLS